MKKAALFFISIFFMGWATAQQVYYSQPDNSDGRNLNFEIVGKIDGNYLVYKNIRNDYAMSIYNSSMDQLDKVDLKMIPERTLSVDFITYPHYTWMVYQFQKKNILYCMAAKLDSGAKLLQDPVVLDTTQIRFLADKKIYTLIHSEDKKQIMLFKMEKVNNFFNFTTLLFDDSMQLHHISKINSGFQEKKYIFSDFLISNRGNMVFTAGNRSSSRDFIENLQVVMKAPYTDSFHIMSINLGGRFLDEVKPKIDNMNMNYLLNSFYYTKKRGNTEGMFTAVISERNNQLITETFAKISDSLRTTIKSKGSDKTALNDYFIRNVVLKNDGGFLLTAEDFYSQSRNSPWNRWDYLYGSPYFYSPYSFYSPFSYYSPFNFNYYGSPYGFYGDDVRYYYNNILVLSLDSTGKYEWTNIIGKSQYDDQTDNYLSYALMITGGQLHFIFNENNRRSYLLADRSINGDGDITRVPPMHNLDRGYQFMPRYAKQVSASEMIVPCIYRNIICFARIQF